MFTALCFPNSCGEEEWRIRRESHKIPEIPHVSSYGDSYSRVAGKFILLSTGSAYLKGEPCSHHFFGEILNSGNEINTTSTSIMKKATTWVLQ